VAYRRGVQGDFDVAATFDELRLPESKDGSVAVELSATVAGNEPTVARVSVSRTASSKLHLTARVKPAGQPVATAEVDSVDGLRIARIQRTVFFLFAEDGFYRLLGMTDVDPGEVQPGAVRFRAVGTRDAAAEALLKTFEVRTTKFTN
jgi:hypothetical protein